MKLSQKLFDQIVDLIQPHMSESGRRTLITPAISVHDKLFSQIDWSGSNRAFTVRLIQQLIDYGQPIPDQDGLVLLLETLHGQVGYDVQAQIDEVLATLSSESSAPSSVPSSVSERRLPKVMQWIALSAVALLFLAALYKFTFSDSAKPPPTPTATNIVTMTTCEYAVVVRDLVTDDALARAQTTLEYQLNPYIKHTSSEGRVQGEFPCTETNPRYRLRVDAAGYLPYEHEFTLQREPARIYLISTAARLCPHVMTVLDKATQAPISNAKVQIEQSLYYTTGYTDSEGYFSADLPCTEELSSINVRVYADGYEAYNVEYYLNDEIQEVRLTKE